MRLIQSHSVHTRLYTFSKLKGLMVCLGLSNRMAYIWDVISRVGIGRDPFNVRHRGYLLFSVLIDFYFTERTPKAVFSRVASPRVKIPLLVFMSEIKINLTLEKIKFSVSFMLKCGKN